MKKILELRELLMRNNLERDLVLCSDSESLWLMDVREMDGEWEMVGLRQGHPVWVRGRKGEAVERRTLKKEIRYRSPNGKLTEGQARAILKRRDDTAYHVWPKLAVPVAKEFGVSKDTVLLIWRRLTWGWL